MEDKKGLKKKKFAKILNGILTRGSVICEKNNWDRSWSKGGCYIHLEVSEFIESLRGKGKNSPAEEFADVMFALLTTAHANGVTSKDMVDAIYSSLDKHEKELGISEAQRSSRNTLERILNSLPEDEEQEDFEKVLSPNGNRNLKI